MQYNMIPDSERDTTPIHFAFVDFQKTLDSIEIWAILESLQSARIGSRYTKIVENVYQNDTFHVKINEQLKTDKMQVDLSDLFVSSWNPTGRHNLAKTLHLSMEDVFKELSWEGKGINIDGTYLNHSHFADDIVLISTDIKEVARRLKSFWSDT